MLSINVLTPNSIQKEIKEKFKNKRLHMNLTQEGLANKSGVSLGSLKRFEKSGQISLESLLKLALVLNCLDGFLDLGKTKQNNITSIDELLDDNKQKKKQRGRIK